MVPSPVWESSGFSVSLTLSWLVLRSRVLDLGLRGGSQGVRAGSRLRGLGWGGGGGGGGISSHSVLSSFMGGLGQRQLAMAQRDTPKVAVQV